MKSITTCAETWKNEFGYYCMWSEETQEDFINHMLPRIPDPIKIPKRHAVYNISCAFDTESTSFKEGEEKRSCCYAWMFGVNGGVIMGRSLDEFEIFCDFLVEKLNLSKDRHLIVYVHNLAWDFQFIMRRFEWDNVFALDNRKPVYALTKNGIEFRCSYILSGMSLAELGTHLKKYHVEKMVGDLDYSLMRHSWTVLTDKEIGYCINDVLVVMAYIQEKIETDGDIRRIQLTKTGYVRKAVRDNCLYENGKHNVNVRKGRKYNMFMKSLSMTMEEYLMARRAFQGGFTHASMWHVDDICYNVKSQDFTSSYPYVCLSEMFPMSKGEKIEITDEKTFFTNLRLYCCMFDIEFENIQAKPNVPDHYISVSKCTGFDYAEDVADNGRLVRAKKIRTTITEIDYQLIDLFYTWDNIRIGYFYRYRKGYLPHDFIDAILNFYEAKTTLKNVQGKEDDYARGKEYLNSIYGMMVTNVLRDQNTVINGDWTIIEEKTPEEQLEIYNNSRKRVNSYLWGIWVTCFARKNLFSAIVSLGDDYVYSDTDSVKYMNPEKHVKYFDFYNKAVETKLRRAMDYQKIPFERCRPKTSKGVEKLIGVWDDEGIYSRFKTLGAKRYMTEKDGKISLTVSGLNKKAVMPYLIDHYKDPFDAFQDGLYIPGNFTGKQTHTYVDEPCDGILVDYNGVPGHYHEESYVHLEPCDYEMSLSAAYIDFLKGERLWTK